MKELVYGGREYDEEQYYLVTESGEYICPEDLTKDHLLKELYLAIEVIEKITEQEYKHRVYNPKVLEIINEWRGNKVKI